MKLLFILLLVPFWVLGQEAKNEQFLNPDKYVAHYAIWDYWQPKFEQAHFDTTRLLPEIRQMQNAAKAQKNDYFINTMKMVELKLYYFNKQIDPNWLLQKYKMAVDDFKTQGELGLVASVESDLGDIYMMRVKNYELAFQHYEQVRKMALKLSIHEYPPKVFELNAITYVYINFEDYQNAIVNAKEVTKLIKKEGLHQWNILAVNYLNIGKSYHNLLKKDSAEYYFSQAIKTSEIRKDTFKIGLSEGFLGEFHYKEKEFRKAVSHLEKSITYLVKVDNERFKQTLYRMYLADCYVRFGNLPKAKKLIYEVENQERFFCWDTDKPEVYRLLSKYYTQTGNTSKSLAYMDSTQNWTKKNQQDFNGRKAMRAQQKQELKRIEAENKIMIFRRNVILGLLVLMFVASLTIYLINIQKKEKELLRARQELERSRIELDRFSKNLKHKRVSDEKIQDVDAQKTLQILEESTIATKEAWEDFKVHFSKVYPDFFVDLLDAYPNLTQGEIRFLSLKKLGFSNKEMAQTLGVSDQSIRTTLYRLRKNIDLSPDDDISKILENI